MTDKPTLYIETSVPSFLLAEPSRDLVASARQAITREWWRRDQARFEFFVSETTLEEAAEGDPGAAATRLKFLEPLAVLRMTPEVRQTAELYVHRRIVPREKPADALHLAFAASYRIQFLCTWNLKHLANALVLQRLRNLNDEQGLFTPQVCTPEQLLGE